MNRRRVTEREATVVGLVAHGRTNAQIALELNVSLATVKRHLNTVMIKWNCANRTQVAVRAVTRAADARERRVAEAGPPSAEPAGRIASAEYRRIG